MDLHAPGPLREVRLQRLGLPEASHLRSHEGARILRNRCPEVQVRIPVSLVQVRIPVSLVQVRIPVSLVVMMTVKVRHLGNRHSWFFMAKSEKSSKTLISPQRHLPVLE